MTAFSRFSCPSGKWPGGAVRLFGRWFQLPVATNICGVRMGEIVPIKKPGDEVHLPHDFTIATKMVYLEESIFFRFILFSDFYTIGSILLTSGSCSFVYSQVC